MLSRSILRTGRRAPVWREVEALRGVVVLGHGRAAGLRRWIRRGEVTAAPDVSGLQRLVSLIRAYLGYEIGFAVNPILMRSEIPPLQLGAESGAPPRLGWNTWMPLSAPAIPGVVRPDADEALFEAEIVEAEELQARRRK